MEEQAAAGLRTDLRVQVLQLRELRVHRHRPDGNTPLPEQGPRPRAHTGSSCRDAVTAAPPVGRGPSFLGCSVPAPLLHHGQRGHAMSCDGHWAGENKMEVLGAGASPGWGGSGLRTPRLCSGGGWPGPGGHVPAVHGDSALGLCEQQEGASACALGQGGRAGLQGTQMSPHPRGPACPQLREMSTQKAARGEAPA